MRLPLEVHLNTLGEFDTDDRGDQIGIDLGTVISARTVLEYSRCDWLSDLHDVQPVRSDGEVNIEYSAYPDGRLYLRSDDGSLLVRELRSLEPTRSPADSPLEAAAIEPATTTREVSDSWERHEPARCCTPACPRPARGVPSAERTPLEGKYRLVRGLIRRICQWPKSECVCEWKLYGWASGRLCLRRNKKWLRGKAAAAHVDIDENTETLTFELEKCSARASKVGQVRHACSFSEPADSSS